MLTSTDGNSEELRPYNMDFTKKYIGHSKLVMTPTTSEQISKLLAYCNSRRLAVVPQGGNTGLVGGSVPVFDEIIISLRKLNKIRHFDEVQGILRCEAGCILEDLQSHVKPFGYIMPLDLGAKGSCMIGGNLATNAGGIKFVKYGSMAANTVGLEVVLPDGKVINTLKMTRREAYPSGLDLQNLFIGSEGTLVTHSNLLIYRA